MAGSGTGAKGSERAEERVDGALPSGTRSRTNTAGLEQEGLLKRSGGGACLSYRSPLP